MTHRDRAWRRRKTRVVEHRTEVTKDWLGDHGTEATTKPHVSTKQHQPGKLTHVQAIKQDWQLRDDTLDGMTGDGAL